MNNQINVYVLTVFFGAGKTMVLNHLLTAYKTKNMVIENEFGKKSIDGGLVFSQFSDVYQLNNGCICCSMDEEPYNVLGLLATGQNRIDNLFIETTGIADAGSVSAVFTRPEAAKVFRLQKVICGADAELVEAYITTASEPVKQLVAADQGMINKTGFVSPDYTTKLESLSDPSIRLRRPSYPQILVLRQNQLVSPSPRKIFFPCCPWPNIRLRF